MRSLNIVFWLDVLGIEVARPGQLAGEMPKKLESFEKGEESRDFGGMDEEGETVV